MKSVLWFVVGAAAGFVAAHAVARTETGERFFSEVDQKARDFGDAVMDGYKAREAELRAAVAEAEDVISDLTKRAKS